MLSALQACYKYRDVSCCHLCATCAQGTAAAKRFQGSEMVDLRTIAAIAGIDGAYLQMGMAPAVLSITGRPALAEAAANCVFADRGHAAQKFGKILT